MCKRVGGCGVFHVAQSTRLYVLGHEKTSRTPLQSEPYLQGWDFGLPDSNCTCAVFHSFCISPDTIHHAPLLSSVISHRTPHGPHGSCPQVLLENVRTFSLPFHINVQVSILHDLSLFPSASRTTHHCLPLSSPIKVSDPHTVVVVCTDAVARMVRRRMIRRHGQEAHSELHIVDTSYEGPGIAYFVVQRMSAVQPRAAQ